MCRPALPSDWIHPSSAWPPLALALGLIALRGSVSASAADAQAPAARSKRATAMLLREPSSARPPPEPWAPALARNSAAPR
jgi:hypothetical protein